MCFVWIWEKTVVVSLYSIMWPVFLHTFNPLQLIAHYIYHQINIQQIYDLPTQLYLCVLCGSENKLRLFLYTALPDRFLEYTFNFLQLSVHYIY